MLTQDTYEYIAHVTGIETFVNRMRSYGIIVSPVDHNGAVEFTSDKLVDLKGLKRIGVVRAYRITKVTKTKEVIEEG